MKNVCLGKQTAAKKWTCSESQFFQVSLLDLFTELTKVDKLNEFFVFPSA